MRRHPLTLGLMLSLCVAAVPVRSVHAQSLNVPDPKPGRDPKDPKEPIDSAYTKKINEYTTEPFFGSPLVDYLPASKTVPTPKVVLGDIAGAPGILPYSRTVYEYMRLLAKATPRVKVFSIGMSEEGREMIAVAVGSDALMAKYEENKAKLAKLADPRLINMDDAQAEKIMTDVAPVYYITGTIHSTEAGAPTALMELAYRLAVDESPYVKNIRDHVITLITPIVEVDGRDRVVDLYEDRKKNPTAAIPSLIYWGHYVAHDNNRDAMGMTLNLTQNVLNTYVDNKAQVLHDLHESVAYLYDNTIGDGPYNAWIDPLLANEWQLIGWNNVQEMTRFGMPGVFAHGTFDTWSPGYLMFIAATHNGVSRLYETYGNGGNADTRLATLGAGDTQRTWYRQNPALPVALWSMRNNNNYEETGLLVSLAYVANNRYLTLQNFYERSKRSIQKARTEGPAAYVLPASDPSLGRQADLLRIMQKQRVEISRATAAFTVQVPVERTAAGGAGAAAAAGAAGRGGAGGRGGGGGGGRGGGRGGAGATPTESREFPAGSYIIRMDQPYSRIADALLDYQYWAPNDPQKSPYDDTGWTFPEGFGVEAVRVVDQKVLDVPVEKVIGDGIRPAGGVIGTGTIFAINNVGDNQLATLRYKLKTADIQAAEEPFEAVGQSFNRGTFIINGTPSATLDATAKTLGLKAYAIPTAPTVAMHPVRAPRVAIVHSWSNTQTEGWWRIAFDQSQVPYDYIDVTGLMKGPTIASQYDVLIFPPGTGNERTIIDGTGGWPAGTPIPWKNSPDTPNIGTWAQTDDIRAGIGLEGIIRIRDFLRGGGLVIASQDGGQFLVAEAFARGVTDATTPRREVDGTLLRTHTLDATSPIVYGMIDNLAVFSKKNGASYNAGGGAGRGAGRGGAAVVAAGARGGGGRGSSRVTGTGRADEPDVVQGRPLDLTLNGAPNRTIAVGDSSVAAAGGGGGRGGGGRGGAGGARGGRGAGAPAGAVDSSGNAVVEGRLRPILGFADQADLLVSGLLDGGEDIAGRTTLVDAPFGKGNVVLFSFDPMYRGETVASYAFVFNALLHFDNLNAGAR